MTDKITYPQKQEVDGVEHVKVRIPVAVNNKGEWMADGEWSRKRPEAIEVVETGAAECGYGNVAVHFVYALVPVPTSQVCFGELDDNS